MNILELPNEIQEKILSYVDIYTDIEKVCELWDELCKNVFLKKYRCVCATFTPNVQINNDINVINCVSKQHKCVCSKIIPKSIRDCKSETHDCVCGNDTHYRNTSKFCRSINHNCICAEKSQIDCRSIVHNCICVIGWEKINNNKFYYGRDISIRRKQKKIIKMNFCCLAGKNNHFCSCEIHPESCISNNCQTNKILHENVQ